MFSEIIVHKKSLGGQSSNSATARREHYYWTESQCCFCFFLHTMLLFGTAAFSAVTTLTTYLLLQCCHVWFYVFHLPLFTQIVRVFFFICCPTNMLWLHVCGERLSLSVCMQHISTGFKIRNLPGTPIFPVAIAAIFLQTVAFPLIFVHSWSGVIHFGMSPKICECDITSTLPS